MSIEYNKKKLLGLFDKVHIMSEDIGEVEYLIFLGENRTFSLYMLPLEEYASLMLINTDKKNWLFEIEIKRLEKIICEEDTLKFYKNDNTEKPALTVKIKPEISLWCRAETPRKED